MLRVQTVSAMMLTLACACAAPVAADLEANESDATKTVSRFENFGGSGTLLW